MITLVKDPEGNVIHDCRELGCEKSWDGKKITASTDSDEETSLGEDELEDKPAEDE